jgi:hypothetical protein
MSPLQAKILGTIVSAIFAGLAFAYPAEAPVLASVAGVVFGALHIARPGDVKAAQ